MTDIYFRTLTTAEPTEYLFDINSETGWVATNEVSLSGSGNIQTTTSKGSDDVAILSGNGNITTLPRKNVSSETSISGTGNISVIAEAAYDFPEDNVILSGSGNISVSTIKNVFEEPVLSETGNISVVSTKSTTIGISLSGKGNITVSSVNLSDEPVVVSRRNVFIFGIGKFRSFVSEERLKDIVFWESWVNIGNGPQQAKFTGQYKNAKAFFDVDSVGIRALELINVESENDLKKGQAVIFPPEARRT